MQDVEVIESAEAAAAALLGPVWVMLVVGRAGRCPTLISPRR